MDLPLWLEEKAVELDFSAGPDAGPDSGPDWGGFYDALRPELRARLKTQIAFLWSFWKERDLPQSARRRWLDCILEERTAPAPWALFLLAESYASPSGLLAAFLPALLAKTGEVLICRVGQGVDQTGNRSPLGSVKDCPDYQHPLPLPLASALELAGVERFYRIRPDEALGLAAELAGKGVNSSGPVVVLGGEDEAGGFSGAWRASLSALALERFLPLSFLPAAVNIWIDPDCRADRDLLLWAQPGARLAAPPCAAASAQGSEGGKGTSSFCHALMASSPDSLSAVFPLDGGPGLGAPLPFVFSPGQEALWLWPELGPDFFTRRMLGVWAE